MAIALGVFQEQSSVIQSLELLEEQGISSKDVALVVRDDSIDIFFKSIEVSGFLQGDSQNQDVRMIEGMVLTQLVEVGIDMFEAVAYVKAAKKGYTVLAARTKSVASPWAAEAMRRAGAVAAIDSETERDISALPYRYRHQYFAHRAAI